MNEYLQSLGHKSRLAKDFRVVGVTSLSSLESVVGGSRTAHAFFAVDATADGEIRQAGGFTDNRFATVYILKKYSGETDRERVMELCREIRKSIVRRIVRDREMLAGENIYVDTSRLPYYEIPRELFSSLTGVYIHISYSVPEDLQYKADEWDAD